MDLKEAREALGAARTRGRPTRQGWQGEGVQGGRRVSEFYHGGSRELQDRFDTRRLADRIEQRLGADRVGGEDKRFIAALDKYFFWAADAVGQTVLSCQ